MTTKKLSLVKKALLEKWIQGEYTEEITNIPNRPVDSDIMLSFPQHRQLFLELLERGTAVNNLSVFLEFRGDISIEVLEQSAAKIIARHEILRTCFSFDSGLPVPKINEEIAISIPAVDLQQLKPAKQKLEARRMAEKEVLKPFDLRMAPLLRLVLYKLSERHHLLLVMAHHTIADGWSLGIFLRELTNFYQAIASNQSIAPPELPIQYADFSHWQSSRMNDRHMVAEMSYWKNHLSGELPVLELPTDYARSARQSFSGGTYRFIFSSQLIKRLQHLSQQQNVTLFMTLLTGYYLTLHYYCGQDDIIVGTPVANRNVPELEELIGVFINTLALRINLSGNPNFLELLEQVSEVSKSAIAHQDLPFEKLVEVLKPQRDLSRTPIFQVVFNMQNSPMPKIGNEDLKIDFLDIDRGISQFELTLMITNTADQYYGTIEYNNELFKPETVERMFQSFLMVLEDAVAHPKLPISKLKRVNKLDFTRFVYELNQTQSAFPQEKYLPQLFEEQVGQTPDAIAIIHEEKRLTYFELNQRANILANQLMARGVAPEVRVGILMNKSIKMVEALLAVLKSGGTYVPINTSFPEERVHFILEDSQVQMLLTDTDNKLKYPGDVEVVCLDENITSKDQAVVPNPDINIGSDQLVNIIYTSGSTGRPKGVMVPHSSLVNLLYSMRTRPGISSNDTLLSVTAISFDIAALELFLPLITGATLVIEGTDAINNPLKISQLIDQHDVNMMQATPSVWQLLLDTGWKGKSEFKALCGGEALTRKLADRLLDCVDSLWNMYGPTETTVWSSVWEVQKGDAAITIGHPIGNTQLYILDNYLDPVSVGVIGELYIGGAGLARGYLNLPELTSKQFIKNIFQDDPSERLYKTGDRARYLPDYSIEILGRLDSQVKINGNRIELGEIEATINQHRSVKEAIVMIRVETKGEKRLIAYFVCHEDQSVNYKELRDFVSSKLPSYMVPAFFIHLETLPLTPNGKVNLKSLPVPEDTRVISGYVAPRNEQEQILASIWQDVLGLEQVGIHDNFFELGGASMQSLRVLAKANMFSFRLTVEDIFEHQTVAELASKSIVQH